MDLLRKASVKHEGLEKTMSFSYISRTSTQSAAVMFQDENKPVRTANEAWLVELPYKSTADQYFFTTSQKAEDFYALKLGELNGTEWERIEVSK